VEDEEKSDRELLLTAARRCDSIIGTGRYLCERVDRIDTLLRQAISLLRPRPWVRFSFFYKTQGTNHMPTITAPNNIITGGGLAFGLIGSTPDGDTFVEPSIVFSPTSAGTVTMQASVQGTPANGATPFTTAGVFTSTNGFTGSVTISADIGSVDNQDVTFQVLAAPPAPETVGFDPTQFAVIAPPVSASGSVTAAAAPH
jgi:hypothetical protein